MTTHMTIATDLLDLLAADTDDTLDDACAALCDTLASAPELIDAPTHRALMRAADAIDPTASTHAAHIRDTIRDCIDPDRLPD